MKPTFSKIPKLREFVQLIASVSEGQTSVSEAADMIDALGIRNAPITLTTIRNELFSLDNSEAWVAYHVLRLSSTFSTFNKAELPNTSGGLPWEIENPKWLHTNSVAECIVYDALQKLKAESCTPKAVSAHLKKIALKNPEMGWEIAKSLSRLSEFDHGEKISLVEFRTTPEMEEAKGSTKKFNPRWIERTCQTLKVNEGVAFYHPLPIPSYESKDTHLSPEKTKTLQHICARATRKEISIAQAANVWSATLLGTGNPLYGEPVLSGMDSGEYVRTWCEITQHAIVRENRLNWFIVNGLPVDAEPHLSHWVTDHAEFLSELEGEREAGVTHDVDVSRIIAIHDTEQLKAKGKTPYEAMRSLPGSPTEKNPWVILELAENGRYNLHVVSDLDGETVKEMAGSYAKLYEVSQMKEGVTTLVEIPGNSPEDAVARLQELLKLSPEMSNDIQSLETTDWYVREIPATLVDGWYEANYRLDALRELPVIHTATAKRATHDYLVSIPRKGKLSKWILVNDIPEATAGADVLAYVLLNRERFGIEISASEEAPWTFHKLTAEDAKLSFMDAPKITEREPTFTTFDGKTVLSAVELQNRPQQKVAFVEAPSGEKFPAPNIPADAAVLSVRKKYWIKGDGWTAATGIETVPVDTGARIDALKEIGKRLLNEGYRHDETQPEVSEAHPVEFYEFEDINSKKPFFFNGTQKPYATFTSFDRFVEPAKPASEAESKTVKKRYVAVGTDWSSSSGIETVPVDAAERAIALRSIAQKLHKGICKMSGSEIPVSVDRPVNLYEFESTEATIIAQGQQPCAKFHSFEVSNAPKTFVYSNKQPIAEGMVAKNYVITSNDMRVTVLDVQTPSKGERFRALEDLVAQVAERTRTRPSHSDIWCVYEFDLGEELVTENRLVAMYVAELRPPPAAPKTEKLSAFAGLSHSTEELELPNSGKETKEISVYESQLRLIETMRQKGGAYAALIPKFESQLPALKRLDESVKRDKEARKTDNDKSEFAQPEYKPELSTEYPKEIVLTVPQFCKRLVRRVRQGELSVEDAAQEINRFDAGSIRETLMWESLISGTVEDSWVGYYIAARCDLNPYAKSAHLHGHRPMGEYYANRKIHPYAASEIMVWEWLNRIIREGTSEDTIFTYLERAASNNEVLGAFLANALQSARDTDWEGSIHACNLLARFEAEGPRRTANPPEYLEGLDTVANVRRFLSSLDGRDHRLTQGIVQRLDGIPPAMNIRELQHAVLDVLTGNFTVKNAIERLNPGGNTTAELMALKMSEEAKKVFAKTWFDVVEHESSNYRGRLFMPALRNLVGTNLANNALQSWVLERAKEMQEKADAHSIRVDRKRRYAALNTTRGKRHIFHAGSRLQLCQEMVSLGVVEREGFLDEWRIRDITDDLPAQRGFLSSEKFDETLVESLRPVLGLPVERARELGYVLTYSISDPRLSGSGKPTTVDSDSWEGAMQYAQEAFEPATELDGWKVWVSIEGEELSQGALVAIVTGYDSEAKCWNVRDLSKKDLERWGERKASNKGSEAMPTKWDQELVRNTAVEMCRKFSTNQSPLLGTFDSAGNLRTAKSLAELHKITGRRQPSASEPWTVYEVERSGGAVTAHAIRLNGFRDRLPADPIRGKWGEMSPDVKIPDTGVLKIRHLMKNESADNEVDAMRAALKMGAAPATPEKPWTHGVFFHEELSGTVRAQMARDIREMNPEGTQYKTGDWNWYQGVPTPELMAYAATAWGDVAVHFPMRQDITAYYERNITVPKAHTYLAQVPQFKDGVWTGDEHRIVRANTCEEGRMNFGGTLEHPVMVVELTDEEASTWGEQVVPTQAIFADLKRPRVVHYTQPKNIPAKAGTTVVVEVDPNTSDEALANSGLQQGVTTFRDMTAEAKTGTGVNWFVRYVVQALKEGKWTEFHVISESEKFSDLEVFQEVLAQGATAPTDEQYWRVYVGGKEFDKALAERGFREIRTDDSIDRLTDRKDFLTGMNLDTRTLHWKSMTVKNVTLTDATMKAGVPLAWGSTIVGKTDIHQETAKAILGVAAFSAMDASAIPSAITATIDPNEKGIHGDLPPIIHKLRIHDEIEGAKHYAVTLTADIASPERARGLVSIMVESLNGKDAIRKIQQTYFANINPCLPTEQEPWTAYPLSTATEWTRKNHTHEYFRNVAELSITHSGMYLVKGYRVDDGVSSMALQMVEGTDAYTAIGNLIANPKVKWQTPSTEYPWEVFEATVNEIASVGAGAHIEFRDLFDSHNDERRKSLATVTNYEHVEFAPTATMHQYKVFADCLGIHRAIHAQHITATSPMAAMAQALAMADAAENPLYYRPSTLHPWKVYNEENGYAIFESAVLKRPSALTFEGSHYLYGEEMGYLVGYYRPGPEGDPVSEWVRVTGNDAEEARDNFRELVRSLTAETMPVSEPTKDHAWELYEFSNAEAAHYLQGRTMPNLALWGRKKRLQMTPSLRVLSIVGSLYGALAVAASWSDIAKTTIKDDLKEIALRGGVKRIRTALGDRLAAFWTAQQTARKPGESTKAYEQRMAEHESSVKDFLMTDAGQGLMAYVVGMVWTVASEYVNDDNVREYGDVVAKEIRVQGGTDVLDAVITDVVFPMVSVLREETTKFKAQAISATTAKSIEAPATNLAVTVTPNTEDMEVEMSRTPSATEDQRRQN